MRVGPRIGLRALLAFAAPLALLPGRPAFAYRPFDSTDAAVAEKGRFEFELGPVQLVSLAGERSLVLPQIVANYGVSQRWELVLEGRHVRRVSGEGDGPRSSIEDTGLFVKGVLREGGLQEKPGWSVACEVGPLLPTIHVESGIGASAALIGSRRIGSATFHLNGTAALTREGHLALTAGAILEGSDRYLLHPVAELLAERTSGSESVVSGLAGLIYRLRDDLAFDVAARVLRIGSATGLEFRAGVTFALGPAHRDSQAVFVPENAAMEVASPNPSSAGSGRHMARTSSPIKLIRVRSNPSRTYLRAENGDGRPPS